MTLATILAFLAGAAARRMAPENPDVEITRLREELAQMTSERNLLAIELVEQRLRESAAIELREERRRVVNCTGGGRSQYFFAQQQQQLAYNLNPEQQNYAPQQQADLLCGQGLQQALYAPLVSLYASQAV